MIISKKHKFIFVRVLKTGSTSAQAMLINSGILGPDDIYSGYQKNCRGKHSKGQNIPPTITASQIRDISLYDIDRDSQINKQIRPNDDGTYALLGHLTPTEMVRLDLLKTEKELMQYKIIGTVRDPIDRFVSAWFIYCDLVGMPKTIESLQTLFRKGQPTEDPVFSKSQKNYFEYEGKLLKNIEVIDYTLLNERLTEIVGRYGGEISEFESLESHHRPEWSKRVSYRQWLPPEIIAWLENVFSEDIKFYNCYAK